MLHSIAGRQRLLIAIILLMLSPPLLDRFAVAAEPVRPNIVFVMLDNCGQEWLGCYGSEEGRTPNIDRLAAEGVRFEHCYTPPICGPSRVQLLTGRYPFRTGFTLHHDAALYSGGGLDPQREVLFPRLFVDAGYATGIFGKWQVNNLYDEPDVLTAHGFQEQFVWPGSVDRQRVSDQEMAEFRQAVQRNDFQYTTEITRRIENRYWDPVFLHNGVRKEFPGRFGPDVAQAAAIEFMRRNADRPFLLYCPMVLTHGQSYLEPVIPTPLNRDADRPQEEVFGEMVQYADQLVGELAEAIEQLGLSDRTYLFVATDNGTQRQFTARFRGQRVGGGLYQLNEAGSDVGLLVHSPQRVAGGRTIALSDFTDIYPTLCELAGIDIPASLVLDGKSHARVLRGQSTQPARNWILNQYHTRRVVRDERYKLYSTGELYDVSTDRQEQHNLADSTDDQVVAARQRLQEVLDSLPPDVDPPIVLRSQSAFHLRSGTEG